MKYLRYPLLGLVTFIIGVVVSPIHFYLEGIGCGRVIDGGGGFSVSSYKFILFCQTLLRAFRLCLDGKSK